MAVTTAAKSKSASANRPRKKAKKVISEGIAHIYATFNNTVITLTDRLGNTLGWSSAAKCGFKSSRKSTPFAAQMAGEDVGKSVAENYGMKSIDVLVRGPGPGRDSAVRALSMAGLKVLTITDATGIPHNGCRPRKKRRV